MNEKPTRDRSVGFTDASYIRQDDAPNMPRCYSFPEEKSSGTKKTVSPLRVGALCLAFFVLGSLLTTAFSDAEKPVVNTKTAVPTPSSETVQTGGDISGAAAEYYNGSDSNAMVPGVQIYAVEDGGPASVAGLCSGDIIIRLNGADIATAADLTAAENGLTPGCKTILIVYRAGEYREVPVVLGELPDEDGEEDHGWCDFDNAW